MTEPEMLERERASDVPEGAEVRADGSYLTPVEDLTDEQQAELLPSETDEVSAEPDEVLPPSEQGSFDAMPRETGTVVKSYEGGSL